MTAKETELLEALETLLLAYDALLPAAKHLALQDYAIINDAPMKARAAIAKVRSGENNSS